MGTVAFISRFTRTELLEVLEQDFVRTARSKGLAKGQIWWLHALPNALIPVATFLGPALGTLLAGAVIVEKVFNWPGMGRMVVDAVFNRDYPLVMGTVVVAALMFIIGLLISDILYTLLDPRIRLNRTNSPMTVANADMLAVRAPKKSRTLWQNAVSHILHDKLTLTAIARAGDHDDCSVFWVRP